MILALGCVGLAACNGGEKETAPEPATTDSGSPLPSGGATPSAGDGLTWNDIPVYSGANQAQKGSWMIPPEQGEWSKVEWRYYETGDSPDEMAAFYKSRMPGQGWEEMAWMEAEGVAWGYYSKNGEADGAMFWCGSEEGKTFFALMRATQ